MTYQRKVYGQAEAAVNEIKKHILHHDLRSGDPLPTENQLCEHLGMSRTVVREAIRTLTALRIVEVRHGRGTFVGDLSMQPMVESLVFRGLLNPGEDAQSLRDIVEVRASLDLSVGEEVIAAWQGRRSPELHQTVEKMLELADAGQTFPQEDRFFHSQLLAPLSNQLFRRLTEAFWDVNTLIAPSLGIPTPADIAVTARAHGQILEAAEQGDLDAYHAAVREHYQPLLNNLDSLDVRPTSS